MKEETIIENKWVAGFSLCRSAKWAILIESFALRRICIPDLIIADRVRKPGLGSYEFGL